ncbi:MAG: translation initiation factor IF-2, partial [Chlamydiae bacterium]|nr:translation initiation factor IF-2 [Chlamydiota bacterium]
NSEKSINNKGSSVQVTIKGRRSLSSSSSDLSNSDSKLSKSEFEARFKALSTISDSENDSDKFDVLKKIKDTKSVSEQKSKERSSKKPQSKDLQNNNFQEKSSQQFASSNKINEKSSISEKNNNNDDEIVSSGNSRNKISIADFKPSVEVDNFDVLNKIRQSVEVSNKQKQEREKVLEEKRKIELERIEKEKENKAKSKKFLDDFENEKNQKKKSQFKENNKFNKRKLTYIVDDEESEQSSFYRKKRKSREIEVQAQKEYKKISREVNLPDLITVADLAERMTEKTGDVVKKLFTMGMVATSNQVIDADTAEIIIGEFGHIANRVSHSDVENILKEEDDNSIEKKSRAPIVTIMGHVDHGKTSLLDAIRSTKVVDSEHGGITQHIGASRIKTPSGKFITFLDTPGHEAFTEMRSRGANITDIVILVVAADDGVKEQTIEAISHAKAANVPIIVAVNKIDKPGADPRRVKNELLSYDIVSEDLGGDVMFIEVSAKQKLNLEKLEEAILLQAELLDLKSPYEGLSSGVVIESRVDPSKGVVVSLLVQKGTLDISDLIVVGTSYGRVRKMVDDNGKNTKTATPSVPVEILGLDQAPSAGEKFFEVKEEKTAREIILYRERKEREEKSLKNSVKSISDIFKQSGASKVKNLNVI